MFFPKDKSMQAPGIANAQTLWTVLKQLKITDLCCLYLFPGYTKGQGQSGAQTGARRDQALIIKQWQHIPWSNISQDVTKHISPGKLVLIHHCDGMEFPYWEPKGRRIKHFIQSHKKSVTRERNEPSYPEHEPTGLTLEKHSGSDMEFSPFWYWTENKKYLKMKN